MNPTQVSVIVPVFNGADFLDEALACIRSQSIERLEVIVVDDGSTDATPKIAKAHQVRYVHQENAGPSAARNHGLRLANGEAIAFLDADDLWPAGSLQTRFDFLKRTPEAQIVQGLIEETSTLEEAPKTYRFINLGCSIYRRSVFDLVGEFDEQLRFNEDVDWFLRAWSLGVQKAVLQSVTLTYRKHGGNMTTGQDTNRQGLMGVLKRHATRPRHHLDPNFPDVVEYLGLPPLRR